MVVWTIRVTVDGEGKTRVHDRYVVAAPVAGRLRRVTLRRGDNVVREGSVVITHPSKDISEGTRVEVVATE